MNYDVIIVRYSELALKSTYVRKLFETTLVTNIKTAFQTQHLDCSLKKEWGRIYLETDNNDLKQITPILTHIFGIISFSPAITIHKITNLTQKTVQYAQQILTPTKSFALRVKRTGTHTFTSQDVAIDVGHAIQKATKASVNLTKPDIEIHIEIRNNKAYLFLEKILGIGGLPLGTQGTLLVPVNEPKSLTAAWFLMRRGCDPIFVTTENHRDMIQKFLQTWYVHAEIQQITNAELNNIKTINKYAKKFRCDAIVTAHHLSKQKPETIQELYTMKQQSPIPLLHPLIALDQKNIDAYQKQIGVQP